MKKLYFLIILLAISSLACGMLNNPSSVSQAVQTAAPEVVGPTQDRPTEMPEKAATLTPTAQPTEAPAAAAIETISTATQSAETIPPSDGSAPFPLVPVVDVNQDGKIDICEAIPAQAMQVALARSLVSDPQPFQDPTMGDGCAFDFGKDDRAAYFAYIAIGTEKTFTDALSNAVRAEPVTSIGDSGFLNYGPDARQLWVRLGDKSILVAIGDEERVDAMLVFGYYLVDYLAHNP